MTKISILIPTYNNENYISSCLESVINQTYKNIEILIINDCSTDNTQKILKEFAKKDKRIKIITNNKNYGYGKSLNIGIKSSKGDYIQIVESDDFIEPEMSEILLNQALKHNTDIIKSDFYIIKKNKKNKSKNHTNYPINQNINTTTNPELYLLKPSVWSFLFKKEFLIKNNIIFNETEGASFQDTSFQFKCLYFAQNIRLIENQLYNYNLDNPNSSINNDKKAFAIINEFATINNFFDNKNNEQTPFKLLFELKAYLWNLKRINKKYKKNFLTKIKDIFNSYDTSSFFKSKKIPLKYKIKLFAIKYCSNFLINLLMIYNF